MSSQDFPTYGRGEPEQQPQQEQQQRPGADQHFAPPTPYGGGTYVNGQPAPPEHHYAQPQPYGTPPGQYGHPEGPHHNQPPMYRPGTPYGGPVTPEPHDLPAYGREQPVAPRDPRAARVVGLATLIAAFYGLLVISVQRVSLRDISQAPGSPLNHPLRTDVIDAIGQLLLVVVGAGALVMWIRDVLARRKAGRQPEPLELGGLLLVAVSAVPILVWLIMVLSTGLGAVDDSVHRLPTAYGWGGAGLLILAVGLFLGYRELKPDVPNPVVQGPPAKAPWE
ncbi:hypothetical protein [Kribbella kalugense]|uniref:Putative membrane protein n=1 Tax=Kribbella kalugense TaxID=2512221 RepID=A0A4R7ZKK4_9ACTN|nr:hypothetical protein [Kribbella kalugense]TDW18327.1 putative membrane protein [Kribbella kalugense]